MPKITDIEKWRTEILLAEDFREKEFGKYTQKQCELAGENIDYFERGFAFRSENEMMITTLNIFHAIIKVVVPAIIFQNPRVTALPEKIESQDVAPLVQHTINHFYKKIEADAINEMVAWDAYVLGYGVSKVGYATKFGMDVVDEEEKPQLSLVEKALIAIGVKSRPEETTVHPEVNYKIASESPYIEYVSPFKFLMDPRAVSIDSAMWVAEEFEKTVKQMKDNKKYKNTSRLKGDEPDIPASSFAKISPSEIEDFKTVKLYEIHYRTDDGIYLLCISKDGDNFEEHYHEKCIYEIEGWQYELLAFNKHGHKLYPISDMTKIKNLQDRLTSTVDAILEQVDRFVPKVAYHGTEVTEHGKLALRDGEIGALVECTKNPGEVFKELAFTQLKADLKVLLDQIVDIITIQTGLTRAQLTGVSSSGTATEAQIEQGGQTLRMTDMNKYINRYSKRQAKKLWSVIKQFVDLEDLQLINGIAGIDQTTGNPKYNWLTIDENQSKQMVYGEFDFDIEVGSTQKPDLVLIRKQLENMFSILARTDVIALMQQQGKKVDLAELLKFYINQFPEMASSMSKIIQPITEQTQGLVNPAAFSGQGGTTSGSQFNALEAQAGMPAPGQPSEIGMSR